MARVVLVPALPWKVSIWAKSLLAETYPKRSENIIYWYENVLEYFISLVDYIKFLTMPPKKAQSSKSQKTEVKEAQTKLFSK